MDSPELDMADCSALQVARVKAGTVLLLEGRPHTVMSITKMKTGKHGAAKAVVITKDAFTGAAGSLAPKTSDRVWEVKLIKETFTLMHCDGGDAYLQDDTGAEVVLPIGAQLTCGIGEEVKLVRWRDNYLVV